MILVAWKMRLRRGDVPDAFLDTAIGIVEAYKGPDSSERMAESLRNIRALRAEQRTAVSLTERRTNEGISLRQYAMPLFGAQVNDLAMCSISFQRAVLNVRSHLDLFNPSVPIICDHSALSAVGRMSTHLDRQVTPVPVEDMKRVMIDVRPWLLGHKLAEFTSACHLRFQNQRRILRYQDHEASTMSLGWPYLWPRPVAAG